MKRLIADSENAGAGLTRRQFLLRSALAGGYLMVGNIVPGKALAGQETIEAFGPFLRIAPDGSVTVVTKHSEMGQGAQSGLAAIVAEELDADWQNVHLEMAPADATLFGHTVLKIQITGGSSSISNSWEQYRKVGAAARAMFVAAAQKQWGVNSSEIVVENSTVKHPASGRQLSFGELLQAAALEQPPEHPRLKAVNEFKLLGTEKVTRLDARSKSDGTARFTSDVYEEGLLTAVVAHSPRFRGKVKSFDAAKALAVPGVVSVFEIPSGVAVVATGFYPAKQGRDALVVEWDDSNAEMRSDSEIMAEHRDIAADKIKAQWMNVERRGEGTSPGSAEARISINYDFPYIAHATMEPMNCVARVEGKHVKLTYGAQSQTLDQANVAPLVGCEPHEVEIETVPMGGSFGRRSVAQADYQKESVEIAKKIGGGKPVKLQWTREDDMRAGQYRPMAHHAINIGVDEGGYPLSWQHRIVSASLYAGTILEPATPDDPAAIKPEGTIVEGVKDSAYFDAIPVVEAEAAYTRCPIPVLWLRSVGHTHTALAMEHSIDQLARHSGIDPVTYRRTLYQRANAARHLEVLELLARVSNWGEPLDGQWQRGIAVHESFGTVVGNVVEAIMENGRPKVRKVIVAIDCGFAVSPDQVRAQMEGGVNYGLTFALYGEVKIRGGIVETSNFHNYQVLRMTGSPAVETHILPSQNAPSGTGEPGTPVVGAALANALLAITGKPVTKMPLVQS